MATQNLVTCDWLYKKTQSGDLGDIVILDVSWASAKDCYEEYKLKHIPGSRHLNVLPGDHTDMYPRNIPSPEIFTDLAQKVGINKSSHVIVYSNSDRAGYFMSGRGWWTLKYYGHENVSILDGGLSKWLQLEFPTTSDMPEVKKGDFVCSIRKDVHRSYEEVRENVLSKSFALVDTRTANLYSENHIPAAKNLTMADLVDNDAGTLKSEVDLKKLFADAGIELTKPVVTHCNSGMSSCTVAFAAELLGANDVSVFHGGFTEWKKKNQSDS